MASSLSNAVAVLGVCLVTLAQADIQCALGPGACQFHCKLFGQSQGLCHPTTHNCECSQVTINNPVQAAVGGVMDEIAGETTNVLSNIQSVAANVQDRLANSNQVKALQEALSITCELDSEERLCQGECRLRLFKGGSCNVENKRCQCLKERISGSEYALCGGPGQGMCGTYCQSKAYTHGVCSGVGNWTCQCVAKDSSGTEIFYDAPPFEAPGNPMAQGSGT